MDCSKHWGFNSEWDRQKALVLCCTQSCLTLCDPTDCSPPGFSAHGILQARTLEWAAISSSRGSSWPRDQNLISCVCCTGRCILYPCATWEGPGSSDGKESACNAGDLGLIPGSGTSPGGGKSNPLQYSCLENSMDRGAWWAIVHGPAKSRTQLSDKTPFLWGTHIQKW